MMRDLAAFCLMTGLLCGCSYTHYKGEASSSAPPPTGAGTGAPVVTFVEVNQQIIEPKCVSCHSSSNSGGGVDLSSYAGVAAQVVAGNPGQSSLYVQVQTGQMPKNGTPLSQAELALVYNWIAQGAQND